MEKLTFTKTTAKYHLPLTFSAMTGVKTIDFDLIESETGAKMLLLEPYFWLITHRIIYYGDFHPEIIKLIAARFPKAKITPMEDFIRIRYAR